MGQPAKFWEWIAKRYARTPVADEASYQKKLEVTRTYFRPDMNVLEIGSGTGSTAITHAPFVGRYLAIDGSNNMTNIARAKIEDSPVPNLTFERSSIDEFDPKGERFDAILALSVLHLLDNMEETVGKVYDLLEPGGIFVTSTVCIGDMKSAAAYIMPVIAPIGRLVGLLPYLRILTLPELEQSLLQAGFRIDHQWQLGEGKSVFIVAVKD